MIWNELPQEAIRKTIVSFRKRMRSCINTKKQSIKLIMNISVLTTYNCCFSALETCRIFRTGLKANCSLIYLSSSWKKSSFILKAVLLLNNESWDDNICNDNDKLRVATKHFVTINFTIPKLMTSGGILMSQTVNLIKSVLTGTIVVIDWHAAFFNYTTFLTGFIGRS